MTYYRPWRPNLHIVLGMRAIPNDNGIQTLPSDNNCLNPSHRPWCSNPNIHHGVQTLFKNIDLGVQIFPIDNDVQALHNINNGDQFSQQTASFKFYRRGPNHTHRPLVTLQTTTISIITFMVHIYLYIPTVSSGFKSCFLIFCW
jgi:hypothetical protein